MILPNQQLRVASWAISSEALTSLASRTGVLAMVPLGRVSSELLCMVASGAFAGRRFARRVRGGVSKRCARHFPRQLFGWQPRALRPRRAAEQRYQKLSGRLLTHLRPGPTIARTSDVLTIILRGSPGTSIEQYHTDMFLKHGMAPSDRDIYSGSSEPEAIRNVVWAPWSPAHASSCMFSHELLQ
jgi:hypothetical protein